MLTVPDGLLVVNVGFVQFPPDGGIAVVVVVDGATVVDVVDVVDVVEVVDVVDVVDGGTVVVVVVDVDVVELVVVVGLLAQCKVSASADRADVDRRFGQVMFRFSPAVIATDEV